MSASVGDDADEAAQGASARGLEDPRRAAPWALGTLVLAVLAVEYRTAWSLVGVTWHSDAYGHGWLVLAIALWLGWRAWPRALEVARGASPLGAAAFVVALGVWQGGELLQIQAVTQPMLFVSIAAAVWACMGAASARVLAFPCLYTLVAVSTWDQLLVPLQEIAVVLTGMGVRWTGIPAFIDHKFISIPEGRFVIETMCAGLRYFLAGLSVALLYAYLYLPTWPRRLALLGVTTVWVLILNGIRIVVIVLMGHAWGMEHPWVKDHGDTGWVIFALGLVPLYFVAVRLEGAGSSAGGQGPPGAGPGRGTDDARRRFRGPHPLPWAATLFGVLLLGNGAVWLVQQAELPLRAVALPGARICEPALLSERGWHPDYPQADAEACFHLPEAGVLAYAAQYGREGPGRELVAYGRDVWSEEDGRLRSRAGRTAPGGAVIETVLETPDGDLRVIWHRYRVGAVNTTSGLEAKLLRLLALVTGGRAATVTAVTPVGPVAPEALPEVRERLGRALAAFRLDGGAP